MHALSWEMVTRPKNMGGLGMRHLYHMKTACIMKLGWELKQNKPHLWCDVLRGKYMGRMEVTDGVLVKGYDSSLWKAIVQCWPKFEEFAVRYIGNSLTTPAWTNDWIGLD